jgi:hypothetical protein
MIFSGIVVEWNIHPASNQLVLEGVKPKGLNRIQTIQNSY